MALNALNAQDSTTR